MEPKDSSPRSQKPINGLCSKTAESRVHFKPYVSNIQFNIVRFQVLTAASMKMAVFWVVVPCNLVEVYRRFGNAYCLIALMMEAASNCEKSVNFYQTTRRKISEDSHLLILNIVCAGLLRCNAV
jgi:hypothetical protein